MAKTNLIRTVRRANRVLLATIFSWALLLSLAGACQAQGAAQTGLLVEYFESSAAPGVQSGVLSGDNLLSYDGVILISPATLLALEENQRSTAGTAVLRVRRDGRELSLSAPRGPLGIVSSIELPEEARNLYRESWIALQTENVEASLAKTRDTAAAIHAAGDKVTEAWVWWSQGVRFGRPKRSAEAAQLYKNALDLLVGGPDVAAQSRAWSALGNCQFAQAKFREATQSW